MRTREGACHATHQTSTSRRYRWCYHHRRRSCCRRDVAGAARRSRPVPARGVLLARRRLTSWPGPCRSSSKVVDAGEPVMAAVVPRHVDLLRDALGGAAGEIQLLDMSRLGANPARIIPAWREFTDTYAGPGRPVRGIGEPVWSARRGSELAECQLHEALLNAAVAPATPLWLMCPYDADGLPEHVLAEARRSHPVVVEGMAPAESSYGGHGHIATLFAADLSPADPSGARTRLPAWPARSRPSGGRVPRRVRRAERRSRTGPGSGGARGRRQQRRARRWVRRHTGVGGDGRTRGRGARRGAHRRPARGRHLPAWDDVGGRGLWLANQLCDLVQIRSRATGTTVRIHTWL